MTTVLDLDQTQSFEGIGLKNIKSRIAYLHGNMEIVAKKGYGVLFTLKLPYSITTG